jgi:hypothetical protein
MTCVVPLDSPMQRNLRKVPPGVRLPSPTHLFDLELPPFGMQPVVVPAALCHIHNAPPLASAAGACMATFLPPTTLCDDGSRCTTRDHCDGLGHCIGTPKVCTTPPSTQCAVSTCNELTGGLSHSRSCNAAVRHNCLAAAHPGLAIARDHAVQ